MLTPIDHIKFCYLDSYLQLVKQCQAGVEEIKRSATLSCGEMKCSDLEYGVYHWSRIP